MNLFYIFLKHFNQFLRDIFIFILCSEENALFGVYPHTFITKSTWLVMLIFLRKRNFITLRSCLNLFCKCFKISVKNKRNFYGSIMMIKKNLTSFFWHLDLYPHFLCLSLPLYFLFLLEVE